jgi:hypothetical protein
MIAENGAMVEQGKFSKDETNFLKTHLPAYGALCHELGEQATGPRGAPQKRLTSRDTKPSLENLGFFRYCFIRLCRFCFISMSLLFGELIIEFLLK